MEKSAEELRGLILSRDTRALTQFVESVHPRVAAECFAQLHPNEIVQALRCVRKDLAIPVFEFFSKETQTAIFTGLARDEMAEFLEEMSPDDRADLVKRLNPDLVEHVLALMAQVDREDIRRLASYQEGTAGAIMTTDYACLPADITVAEALDQLRVQAPDRETIYDVYVVDADRRLQGVAHLKDLIIARPAAQTKVADIMHRDAISVHTDDDAADVARTIANYDLIAVPVVDSSNRLVGIVTVDDAMDVLDPDARDPSAGGKGRRPASPVGYVDRVAWAVSRSRGLWLMLAAFILVGAWLFIGSGNVHYALVGVTIGLPLIVALGASPGARCGAAMARDLIRERPVLRCLVANLTEEVRLAMPAALVTIVAVGLLLSVRSRGPSPQDSRLLVAGTIGIVVQVLAAALCGAMVAIITRKLRLPVERRLAPTLGSLPDALGMLVYFAIVGPALRRFIY